MAEGQQEEEEEEAEEDIMVPLALSKNKKKDINFCVRGGEKNIFWFKRFFVLHIM